MLNPFKWFRRLFHGIGKLPGLAINKYRESLRLQLIMTFAICFFVALFVGGLYGSVKWKYNRAAYIDYKVGMTRIDVNTRMLAEELDIIRKNQPLNNGNYDYAGKSLTLVDLLNLQAQQDNVNYLISNLDGKILYKSQSVSETQLDLHSVIQNAMEFRTTTDHEYLNRKEFISFYPITLQEGKVYLIGKGIPEGIIGYKNDNSIMPYLVGVIIFFLLFYYLTKRKMAQIVELSSGLQEMAKGNLGYRVREVSQDQIGLLAVNINRMAGSLQQKIEDERRAEKIKNELITNVSHDLRTPLTSIMGYLRLIKDHKVENEQQMEDYLQIVTSKSDQLKLLIDDLFDYTKLSNRVVRMEKANVCLNELLSQLCEEVVPLAEENKVNLIHHFPEEPVMVYVDPNQIARVFENLLTNGIRYCYKPGKVKIAMEVTDKNAIITVENQGDFIPRKEIDRLFDRFYKGDTARSSGGSGLGLAIAKSIVELHDGEVWAECQGNSIQFHVKLPTIT